MGRCLGHFAAVSSSDDGEGVGFELIACQFHSCSAEDGKLSTYHLNIAAGMVVVAAMCQQSSLHC